MAFSLERYANKCSGILEANSNLWLSGIADKLAKHWRVYDSPFCLSSLIKSFRERSTPFFKVIVRKLKINLFSSNGMLMLRTSLSLDNNETLLFKPPTFMY